MPGPTLDVQAEAAHRWQRASALFDELADLEPGQRGERLAEVAVEDAQLADMVRELLDSDQRQDARLDAPAGALVPSMLGEIAAGPNPQASASERYGSIGPYRVLGTIGVGGMGEVLLAERADGYFDQRVAIKLLKRGMDTDAVLRRFLQERRILARLAHPNIARLLDGGMTADGLPYFVMEYVEGQPITVFAKDWRLALRQRVELMLHVCEAVDFAHRKLVVHRDLKPSNILVDGSGGLKLLDFGIAKMLNEEHEETMTEAGMRVMTPAYAAPEQILGEPVTTATDVYALGVLLFELVTGMLPHQRGKRGLDALADEISRESAERPSTALRRQARSYGTSRDRRRRVRELEGDLDTIVLSALQREPERRYGTAAAFGDDLKRWLEGRPISARRESGWYRARKFMQRHRLGFAASIAGLLTLLSGLAVALWQADLAHRSAAMAAAEAQRAEQQARQASRTKDFVVGMISRINPYETSRGPELSAAQLLETASAELETGLADAPAAQAELRAAIARSLFRLGSTAEALPLIDRAVAQLRELEPQSAPTLADALTTQATVHTETGDFAGAEAMNREALALMDHLPGDHRRERISVLTGLAKIANLQGRAEEALALREQIMPLRIALVGTEDPDIAMDYQNLAASYLSLDRFADAEDSYRRAEAMLVKLLGPEHQRLSYIWHGLGVVLLKRGRYEEAETVLLRARSLQDRSLKPGHPNISTTRQVLGQLYFWQGREADAERETELAYASVAPAKGPTLPYIEWLRARLFLSANRPAEALASAQAAVAGLAAIRGAEDPLTLQARALAALADFRAGSDEAGARDLEEVVDSLQASKAAHAEELAEACVFLAEVKSAQGERDAALSLYERALSAYAPIVAPEHPQVRAIVTSRDRL